jgi:drug/metabolite transporter (DMT)-like permease
MQTSNPWKAFAWMMGAVVSFTAMVVAGRALLTGMNTFELMLYRSLVGFVVVAAVVARSGRGFAEVRSRRPGLHLLRNAFHYTGQNLWFFAVAQIALGQLVALEFTNPIWVALLAPLLLGERLTPARLFSALLGFVGVLIVARPGVAPLEAGHFAALAAALCFALNTIFTRQIMGHDSVLCVLFWMTLLQGAASLVLSLPGGIPVPGAADLGWIVVVGLTGLTAHYSLTSALGHAPASIVAPMEFIRLPVIALVGTWLYGEPLSLAVFLGAALIIAGNLVNLRAETRRTPA